MIDQIERYGISIDRKQQDFCEDNSGSIRLLAPAGSGKTQAILWRCLYLIDKAQRESKSCKILIITFTKVARDELRLRISLEPIFAPLLGNVDINTLNAWGYRWLKPRVHNPRLLTSASERSFLVKNDLQPIWIKHRSVKEALTDSRFKYSVQQVLMDKVDFLKALGFRHDRLTNYESFSKYVDWLEEAGLGNHYTAFVTWLVEIGIIESAENQTEVIYKKFFRFWVDTVKFLNSTAKLSLEDQKYWTLIGLDSLVKLKKYTTGTSRYHHIMVDEFQDINVLDFNLIRSIAEVNKTELTIVGDDDQAIYEWRGASPKFILKPDQFTQKSFSSHILSINYRCPDNIVKYSQKLIENNKDRVRKNVVASSKKKAIIDLVYKPSVEHSVDYVVELVKSQLLDKTINNIALISRKRSQIIPYQIVFAGSNVPFYAAEDLNVMLSDTFQKLKELLLIKAQSNIPKPFGLDPVDSLIRLCDKVKRYPLKKVERDELASYLRSMSAKTLLDAAEYLKEYRGELKGKNIRGQMSLVFYDSINRFLQTTTVSKAIQALSENFSGLQKDYGKSLDDIFYADPPFIYLSAYAERYGDDLASFYSDVEKAIETLVSTSSFDYDLPDESLKRKLHMMTALRAKGKEFDSVILLDCNEGIWPSKLAETEEQMEAERRVFYVAFTRAKKRITIVVNEKMLGTEINPTPYLCEMGLS
jgi:DNA helicase II / ATP-dependent DNA helicase PcrA